MTRARDNATQGGLVLVNKTDFTSASTLSFNNVFSSTYDRYKIVYSFIRNNYNNNFSQLFNLRASGVDNTASSYVNISSALTNSSVATGGLNSTATSFYLNASYYNSDQLFGEIILSYPYLANKTYMNFSGNGSYSASNTTMIGSGIFNATNQFDGFTLSNMTMDSGKISIYGMK